MGQRIRKPLVNIVIRSYNEEDWIRSCLTTVFRQDYPEVAVTLVDSGSTDATLKIAKEFPTVNIVTTDGYLPGKAINAGIAAGDHKTAYVMLLSAHCLLVGTQVISTYVTFLEDNPVVAGAYGRQLPLPYTGPDDTRDLLNSFGTESRVQRLDTFFHNANSMVRRDILEKIPFDDSVKHIEDRMWAGAVIEEGYHVAYLANAQVYHYHGLHQHGRLRSFRAEGVSTLLRQFSGNREKVSFEESHCRRYICPTLIIINDYVAAQLDVNERLEKLLDYLGRDQQSVVLSSSVQLEAICVSKGAIFMSKEMVGVVNSDSFRELSRKALNQIESTIGTVVDALSFVDLSYCNFLIDNLILSRNILFERFHKAVLPAWRDHGNYWKREGDTFIALDVSFEVKEKKSAIYRSALGQGGCVRASQIRSPSPNFQVDELVVTDDIDLIRRFNFD